MESAWLHPEVVSLAEGRYIVCDEYSGILGFGATAKTLYHSQFGVMQANSDLDLSKVAAHQLLPREEQY